MKNNSTEIWKYQKFSLIYNKSRESEMDRKSRTNSKRTKAIDSNTFRS